MYERSMMLSRSGAGIPRVWYERRSLIDNQLAAPLEYTNHRHRELYRLLV